MLYRFFVVAVLSLLARNADRTCGSAWTIAFISFMFAGQKRKTSRMEPHTVSKPDKRQRAFWLGVPLEVVDQRYGDQ